MGQEGRYRRTSSPGEHKEIPPSASSTLASRPGSSATAAAASSVAVASVTAKDLFHQSLLQEPDPDPEPLSTASTVVAGGGNLMETSDGDKISGTLRTKVRSS